ncbi:MAG: PIN domain-containing protein [Pseudomonadota bacterium]
MLDTNMVSHLVKGYPVAELYGVVRAKMTAKGKILAPLDLLIASHALIKDAILVTSDHAFAKVPKLRVEDWTR